MKHHKGIVYDGFMLLSRIECKKNCIFFKISKYILLCKVVPMVILHHFLSAYGLTRELSMMINLHLT